MDKTRHIKLKHFHENDGGRAKNGTQCKQCGKECKCNKEALHSHSDTTHWMKNEDITAKSC